MPTAILCLFEGEKITVAKALKIKATQNHWSFGCIECQEPVNPHGGESAHFEHLSRNPDCSLSHKKRKRKSLKPDYNFDDSEAFEGYRIDKKWASLSRNKKIIEQCKIRDKHTCQACGFILKVGKKFVIECHHKTPLHIKGEGIVTLKDLVCLCPTCHRVAHTREKPFTPKEIKALLKNRL